MRNGFPLSRVPRLLVWTLLLGMSGAQAQWVWLDANGRKVFSDRPPPAEVPDGRIVSSPSQKPASSTVSPPNSTSDAVKDRAAGADGPAANAKPDAAARKLEEQKKQSEEAEKAKERAAQQQAARAKADNCVRAKGALANLETGTPLRILNAKGERVYMDETLRNAEKARLQQMVRNNCSR